jgi:hypothetical protein
MIDDVSQHDKDRLKEWLPRLAHFHTLLESEPIVVQQTTKRAEDVITTAPTIVNLSVAQHEAATPSKGANRQQIVHLPLDGLVSKMSKVNPFVLGLGCIGQRDRELLQEIVDEIALGCASKSGRNAVVIRIQQVDKQEGHRASERSTPSESTVLSKSKLPHHLWHDFGESKMEKRRWNTQLLELLRLRKEFGLILIDLGNSESQAIIRLGRLCDGVVIQVMDQVSPKTIKTAINNFKQEQLHLLGILSLECVLEQELLA